ESAVPVNDFKVTEEIFEGKVSVGSRDVPILHAPLVAPKMSENADDPDLCEYLVRVEWIKTVPRTEAYWEKGLFALQHTACRLTSSFTIERLSQHFGLDE